MFASGLCRRIERIFGEYPENSIMQEARLMLLPSL